MGGRSRDLPLQLAGSSRAGGEDASDSSAERPRVDRRMREAIKSSARSTSKCIFIRIGCLEPRRSSDVGRSLARHGRQHPSAVAGLVDMERLRRGLAGLDYTR